jgi:hypothetical protein
VEQAAILVALGSLNNVTRVRFDLAGYYFFFSRAGLK